jgi:hypothetical protein
VFTDVHLPPKDVRRFVPQPQMEEPAAEEEPLLLEVGDSGSTLGHSE